MMFLLLQSQLFLDASTKPFFRSFECMGSTEILPFS
jgi:hypothetical protein